MTTQSWKTFICIFCLGVLAMAGDNDATMQPVRTIATALDHLTVLEYDEAVKEAAIGSSSFQVERQENKVFVKPLKPGVSTNLFVWTASNQHYAYELSVTDVTQMNAEVHIASRTLSQPDKTAEIEQASEMAVTRALTNVERVDASSIKTPKRQIAIRFEEIVHTDKTVYIRYAIQNRKAVPYQLTAPVVYQLKIEHPEIDFAALKGKQVDLRKIMKHHNEGRMLIATIGNFGKEEVIAPGSTKESLLAIPRTDDLTVPSVLELTLPDHVQAVIVL